MTDFRRCFPAIFLHFSQELLSPPATGGLQDASPLSGSFCCLRRFFR